MNTTSIGIGGQQEPLLLVPSHSSSFSWEQGEGEGAIGRYDDDHDADVRSTPGKLGGDESPGLFIWLLTFSAGISGLLFGCEFLVGFWRRLYQPAGEACDVEQILNVSCR